MVNSKFLVDKKINIITFFAAVILAAAFVIIPVIPPFLAIIFTPLLIMSAIAIVTNELKFPSDGKFFLQSHLDIIEKEFEYWKTGKRKFRLSSTATGKVIIETKYKSYWIPLYNNLNEDKSYFQAITFNNTEEAQLFLKEKRAFQDIKVLGYIK